MGYEYIAVSAALFVIGACVGSFMDVVRDRGRWSFSLSDRSHCAACGKTLAWKELIPIVSYLLSWGKCRSCGTRIPAYHLHAEVLTGALFACAFLFTDSSTAATAGMLAAFFLVPILVADIDRMEVPEHLSVPFMYAAFIFAAVSAVYTESIVPIVSGFALAAPFYLIWLLSSGRAMGLGDAKVALPLGFLLPSLFIAMPAPAVPVLYAVMSVVMFSFWFGMLGVLLYMVYMKVCTGSSGISRHMHTPLVPGIAVAYFFVFFTGVQFPELVRGLAAWM